MHKLGRTRTSRYKSLPRQCKSEGASVYDSRRKSWRKFDDLHEPKLNLTEASCPHGESRAEAGRGAVGVAKRPASVHWRTPSRLSSRSSAPRLGCWRRERQYLHKRIAEEHAHLERLEKKRQRVVAVARRTRGRADPGGSYCYQRTW